MKLRVKQNLSYANVMATFAVFLALGGGAVAATNTFVGASGEIHGCVPRKGGALDVVKKGRRCPRRTVPLTFYQKGVSNVTRWGNILVAPGASRVLATVGPFTLTGTCDSKGTGIETLKSSNGPFWVYGEDGSYAVEGKPGEEMLVGDDEDTDEAFYAWSPGTGVTVVGQPFNWRAGHTSSDCEFQGQITQTS